MNTYIHTIGIDFLEKEVEIDGKNVMLQVWDTAGQDRFRTLIRPYYRGAAGMVLAYDVTDEKTFQNIEEWMIAIAENTQEFQIIQKIVLANKTDLNPELHRVSEQEGRQLAAKHGIDFYAVSAKEGLGISEAFMHLTKLVLKAQESMKARRRSVWSAASDEDDIIDLQTIPVHAKKDKTCCSSTKSKK